MEWNFNLIYCYYYYYYYYYDYYDYYDYYVKLPPLKALMAHEGCAQYARVYIFAAMALGRGRVANLTLGHLYPRYSFYRRLSGRQYQSGHGVRKNLHPSATRNGTRAVQPIAKRLAASATQ